MFLGVFVWRDLEQDVVNNGLAADSLNQPTGGFHSQITGKDRQYIFEQDRLV
jgi:hypothetical protein